MRKSINLRQLESWRDGIGVVTRHGQAGMAAYHQQHPAAPDSQRALRDRWFGEVVEYPSDVERPKTRGDCIDGPRPCPWVSCRFNNYLDVSPRGSIKLNFPDREPAEVPADKSCALDIADQFPGGAPLPVVQAAIGLSYVGRSNVQRRP